MDGSHKTEATLICDTAHYCYVCSACGERFKSVKYIGVNERDEIVYRQILHCPHCGRLFSEVRYG